MPETRVVNVPMIDEDGRRLGTDGVELSVQCATCRHLVEGLSCEAFPDGIPEAIRNGGHDHRLPFPGDDGVRYRLDPRVKAPEGEKFSPPPRRERPAALRNRRRRIAAQLRRRFGRRP